MFEGKAERADAISPFVRGWKEIPVQVQARERADEVVFFRVREPISFCVRVGYLHVLQVVRDSDRAIRRPFEFTTSPSRKSKRVSLRRAR